MPNQPVIIPAYNMDLFDKKIEGFYLSDKREPEEQLKKAASLFLDCPYLFEPLGEGPDGKYDQNPLYRTDIFDCVTYLDTVLALSKSQNLADFKHNLMQIRYANGVIDYTQRTDWFTDLEWLPRARQLGWISDVTTTIKDQSGKILTETAETIIDKPNWYHVKTLRALHHKVPLTTEASERLLKELREEGHAFHAKPSQLNYIPTDRLLDENGNPNMHLWDQIPSGCVVVFARPNWEIRDHFKDYPNGYGTNLNVCHVGLLLRTNGTLMHYNASGTDKKVLAVPLIDYAKYHLLANTIKGIHIEKILF